jgi:archaeal holliday junction resolvase (hjc)
MTNKASGNKFEEELAQKLFNEGFWVHRLTQNSAGQPADIIAVKDGLAYLIDAKVCEGDIFPFSRVEGNQRTAMALWEQCGNGTGWFAILIRGGIQMIPYNAIAEIESMGEKSLSYADLLDHGYSLYDWLNTAVD